jgi:hypothetical protein
MGGEEWNKAHQLRRCSGDLRLRGENWARKALVQPRLAVRTLPLVHSSHSCTICRQPGNWQPAFPPGHTHLTIAAPRAATAAAAPLQPALTICRTQSTLNQIPAPPLAPRFPGREKEGGLGSASGGQGQPIRQELAAASTPGSERRKRRRTQEGSVET